MIFEQPLSRSQAAWLFAQDVQKLLAVLSSDGGAARVVGGAVRNTLLMQPVDDIDIATTWQPQQIMARAQAAGFHTVPTGIDFGTVTVIIDHRPFEVTTLRQDVRSDGRHAIVAFGDNWHEDAKRRDFTINALYCDAQGTIYDEVGGLDDIKARQIRFIGDARARIEEDYLRILRFFRFFAYYGDGRPDALALKAIVNGRDGLKKLSNERIWSEVKKLLRAPDPHRSLLWMRQSGVLSLILPESDKWGIDLIGGLIAAEKADYFSPDPLLRLMGMIPPEVERVQTLAHRLKLSNGEKKRLINWAHLDIIHPDINEVDLRKMLYRAGQCAVADRVKLDFAAFRLKTGGRATDGFHLYQALLKQIDHWHRPTFPLNGRDLIALGMSANPELGQILARLESAWIMSDFRLTKDELLAKINQDLSN